LSACLKHVEIAPAQESLKTCEWCKS